MAINKDLTVLDSHVEEKRPDHLAVSPCIVVDEDWALLFHIRIFYNFNEKGEIKIASKQQLLVFLSRKFPAYIYFFKNQL